MSHPGLVYGNEFDDQLLRHVAPESWVNPTPKDKYDLVVIGAGPAGLVAAAGAAGLGARVALIERGLLGGDCLNAGCVPSKALLAAARAAHQARTAGKFGVQCGEVRVDFTAVMDRMRRLRSGLAHHDSAARFTSLGVDVFLGNGSFSSPDSIAVEGAILKFRKALIATGARALVPAIPGLKEAGFHTNETLFALTALPRHLLVVGGGPIGCEMAQAFRRFGAEVTMIEREELLPKDEPTAVEMVRAAFRREGIRIMERMDLLSVAREGDVRILKVRGTDGEVEIRGDALLMATGRALNIEGLNLDAAGIAKEGRGLKLNDKLRTTNRRVFAAGDIAAGPQFTHAAEAHARLVLRNAFFFGRAEASDLLIPWCTYTDPEVAQVGLTEAMTKTKGLETTVYRVDFSDLDRGVLEEEGFIQALVLTGTDRVLGFTIVGPRAGDLAGEAALLMKTTGRLSTLDGVIHPYPTVAEAFKRLGGLAMKAKFTPGVARLFKRYFDLMR